MDALCTGWGWSEIASLPRAASVAKRHAHEQPPHLADVVMALLQTQPRETQRGLPSPSVLLGQVDLRGRGGS